MNDLIENLLYLALVMFAIQLVLRITNSYLEAKLEAHLSILERLNEIIHVVKVEEQGNMIYWFDKDTDQFLAQGRTRDEIIAVLKERFTKHVFVVNDSEMLVGPEFTPVPVDAKQIKDLNV